MLINGTVSAWDTYSLNNASFRAVIPPEAVIQADAQISSAQRPANHPVYGGKSLNGRTLPLVISLAGDLNDRLSELTGYGMLNAFDNRLHKLHVVDSASKDWYVLATVSGIPRLNGNVLTVNLYVPDPVWRSNTVNNTAWPITSTADKQVVAIAGNMPALPVIELTLTGAGTVGFSHRRFIKIYNRTRETFTNWPLDITNGGLNTSALVSGGALQADGDDLRLMKNGVFDNFWMSSATPGSETALKIWEVFTLKPKIEMTLGVAIPSSGVVGEITLQNTSANKSLLSELPTNGLVEIDSELFACTIKNQSTLKIAVAERAARDTAMAAHSVGATVRWIPFDLWLLYGDASATAFATDDTCKPAFNLASSTNTQWVYTEFGDLRGLRAGAWKPAIIKSNGGLSVPYRGNHGDLDADPATEMGMQFNNWMKSGKWQGESAEIEWRLVAPCGISQIAASGEKHRASASWPAKARLEKYVSSWGLIWNESSPVALATWTAWNRTAVSLGNAKQARFVFEGSISSQADNQASFEVEAVTVDLTSANVPSVTLASDQASTWMEGRITNNRTGEYFDFAYPMKTNTTLTIDTARKLVLMAGAPVNTIPRRSSDRLNWLELLPPNAAMAANGNNELEFTMSGTMNITGAVKWEDRAVV